MMPAATPTFRESTRLYGKPLYTPLGMYTMKSHFSKIDYEIPVDSEPNTTTLFLPLDTVPS
jgi:hypothetical protein